MESSAEVRRPKISEKPSSHRAQCTPIPVSRWVQENLSLGPTCSLANDRMWFEREVRDFDLTTDGQYALTVTFSCFSAFSLPDGQLCHRLSAKSAGGIFYSSLSSNSNGLIAISMGDILCVMKSGSWQVISSLRLSQSGFSCRYLSWLDDRGIVGVRGDIPHSIIWSASSHAEGTHLKLSTERALHGHIAGLSTDGHTTVTWSGRAPFPATIWKSSSLIAARNVTDHDRKLDSVCVRFRRIVTCESGGTIRMYGSSSFDLLGVYRMPDLCASGDILMLDVVSSTKFLSLSVQKDVSFKYFKVAALETSKPQDELKILDEHTTDPTLRAQGIIGAFIAMNDQIGVYGDDGLAALVQPKREVLAALKVFSHLRNYEKVSALQLETVPSICGARGLPLQSAFRLVLLGAMMPGKACVTLIRPEACNSSLSEWFSAHELLMLAVRDEYIPAEVDFKGITGYWMANLYAHVPARSLSPKDLMAVQSCLDQARNAGVVGRFDETQPAVDNMNSRADSNSLGDVYSGLAEWLGRLGNLLRREGEYVEDICAAFQRHRTLSNATSLACIGLNLLPVLDPAVRTALQAILTYSKHSTNAEKKVVDAIRRSAGMDIEVGSLSPTTFKTAVDRILATSLWSLSEDHPQAMQLSGRRRLENVLRRAGCSSVADLRKDFSSKLGVPCRRTGIFGVGVLGL